MAAVQQKYEDALRAGLQLKARVDQLEDAIGEYLLWQPGRKGHAAALRELRAVWEVDPMEFRG